MNATNKLVTDLKRVMHDSEELLQETREAVDEKAQGVRNRLSNALVTAKRTCRDLESKAVEGAKSADRTIRNNPYQAIGLALGIGLLFGALLIRKH